jgi:hypothetical protein
MTLDQFWQIVDDIHEQALDDMDQKCDLLGAALNKLSAPEIQSFADHFDAMMVKAYTWELWGAAYVIAGGCSDDSFMDFRATLISMGQDTFAESLEDPDSLADLDLDEEDACYEGYQYVAAEVYEKVTGEQLKCNVEFPDQPTGELWDEDSVYELYPRLAEMYE